MLAYTFEKFKPFKLSNDVGANWQIFVLIVSLITFSTSSSKAHWTPSFVFALASINSILCRRANCNPQLVFPIIAANQAIVTFFSRHHSIRCVDFICYKHFHNVILRTIGIRFNNPVLESIKWRTIWNIVHKNYSLPASIITWW